MTTTRATLLRKTAPGLAAVAAIGLATALAAAPRPALAAGAYEFVPAPQSDLNRLYRIDRVTGEVSSCQYALKEGTVGVTLCFGPGEGAERQEPGEYGLVASNHEREGGVFRVDYRSGEMSVCYVFEEKVVCTPPETVSPIATAEAPSTPDTTGATR
ncbi:hypothetical protein [Salinarimonas ramus]|uniref:Uncharacterized protein n=1 Tax=Salinarimonas ramus TaxID=690164 RepID=A0A917QAT0_9HYPH|nr:hypothetical protein [Salinarimonas ramus]GGK40012.1 hypothetical protein GCM10011322_28990 [Salinarimonas ramus]